MTNKECEDLSESKKKKKKHKSWLREDPAGKAVHVSATGADVAKSTGAESLAAIGQAAPVLQVAAMAYDAYQIGRNVEKDRRRGTSRNTVKKVTTTASSYGAGAGGALAGAALGTAICPGVGTILGGLIGGVTCGIAGGYGSGKAAEIIMDQAEYDSEQMTCATCKRPFLWRKYTRDDDEEEEELSCDECREKNE